MGPTRTAICEPHTRSFLVEATQGIAYFTRGMRRRAGFWRMTAVNGYRWAIGVTDNLGRLAFIAALLGAPAIVIAVGHYPWPWVASGVITAAIVILGEGAYRTWADTAAATPQSTTLPILRLDDDLIADQVTRNHSVYFRLRFRNDGDGAITPEVRVIRVVMEDGTESSISGQLPLLLGWSSRKTPPVLTKQHTAGETVGVLGLLNWEDSPTGAGSSLFPPLVYVPGSEHHAKIAQVWGKVFVQVQAIVPGYPQVPTIERWFWVATKQVLNEEAMKFRCEITWGWAKRPPRPEDHDEASTS